MNADSRPTNTSCNPLETNLEFLRSLISFAYEQGYHEHGYDVLEETLSQLYTKEDVEALAAIAVAGARHVAQDCDGPGEEDGPWAEGYAQRTACLPLEPAGRFDAYSKDPKQVLAVMALQSDRYGTDADFKEAVDNVLHQCGLGLTKGEK